MTPSRKRLARSFEPLPRSARRWFPTAVMYMYGLNTSSPQGKGGSDGSSLACKHHVHRPCAAIYGAVRIPTQKRSGGLEARALAARWNSDDPGRSRMARAWVWNTLSPQQITLRRRGAVYSLNPMRSSDEAIRKCSSSRVDRAREDEESVLNLRSTGL
jgi:hypothetical protein